MDYGWGREDEDEPLGMRKMSLNGRRGGEKRKTAG